MIFENVHIAHKKGLSPGKPHVHFIIIEFIEQGLYI